MRRRIALFCFLLLMVSGRGLAADFPELTNDLYVQDEVGILTEQQKEELRQLGRGLEDATTAQIMLLVIPTLEGEPIESYANEAFRHYGVGSEEENNGVWWCCHWMNQIIGKSMWKSAMDLKAHCRTGKSEEFWMNTRFLI